MLNKEIKQAWQEARDSYRNEIYRYIREFLDARGGFFSFADYEYGGPSVTYDGGNHPEYASNAFSELLSLSVNDGKIFLEIDDCDCYSVDRVWSLDELSDIADILTEVEGWENENKL